MVGEVQRPRASQRGHLYLELVEKGRRDEIVGKLDAVLWRTDHQRVRRLLKASGQEIADGVEIRCRCRLDFYPPGGRLQLVVREVDPLFTLGHLERRRRETLAALEAADLLDRNRRLPLPDLLLRIGLITSENSAAFHDFLSGLVTSGHAFKVWFHHAAMQGREAERDVRQALATLESLDLDAVVLTRGGGSRTDLSVFDSRAVAEAIARCRLPVLTGLGHEIDQAIADRVSHRAFKTPTEAAAFLIERLDQAELRLQQGELAFERLAAERLGAAEERLRRVSRAFKLADLRLRHAGQRTEALAQNLRQTGRRRLQLARREIERTRQRLVELAPRRLQRQRTTPDRLAARIVAQANGHLRAGRAVVDGLGRLCDQLSPQWALERGYSMTFDSTGRLLRAPDQVAAGEKILTRLAGGDLSSRVETS